jgi:hypothetical protein
MRKLIYILIVFLPLIACQKKWKKTSVTNFSFSFIKSKPTVDYILIEEGTFYLTSFSVEGVRKKGEDLSFTEDFEAFREIDIEESSIEPILSYDIPQGEYTMLEFKLKFEVYDTLGSLVIKGEFKDSNEDDLPFVLIIEDRIEMEIMASGQNENIITIYESIISEPMITFDIVDWFEHIPQGMFENADTNNENGIEVIHINKSNNYLLYSLILERIGETATVIF